MDSIAKNYNSFHLLFKSSLLLLVLGGSTSANVSVAAPQDSQRMIVKFRAEPGFSASSLPSPTAMSALDRLEAREQIQTKLLKKMGNGAQVIEVNQGFSKAQLYGLLFRLNQDAAVEYAEPDLWMVPSADPTIPNSSQQWYLSQETYGIEAQSAWQYATGEGAVVAVVDSGVAPHEDLLANLITGYDFIEDLATAADGDGRDSDASDPGDYIPINTCDNEYELLSTWHGTQVAGVIAAQDNDIGIVGVAPNAKLLSLRVLGRCGGHSSDIIAAIESVADASQYEVPIDVLNLSLNSDEPGVCGASYQAAIDAALAAGILVVVSTGNNGSTDEYPPANCQGVLAVTASDRDGMLAQYAGRGEYVSLAAPGGQQRTFDDLDNYNGILTTGNNSLREYQPGNDSYVQANGTSFSAAVVSGVGALLRSYSPSATVAQLKAAILASAQPFAVEQEGSGAGILNAGQALQNLLVATSTDLSVTMLGNNGFYVPALAGGGFISYRVMIDNQSEQPATGVKLELGLPQQTVSFVDITASDQGSCVLSTGSCEWPELPAGAQTTVDVVVQTEVTEPMDFSAQISSFETELTQADNQISARFGGAMQGLTLLLLSGLLLLRRQLRK